MKVLIGPHVNWVGPFQIAEKILFWKDKDEDRSVHEFGRWLSENRKGEDSLLTKVCQWIYNKQKRKIKIKIHNYDTWNVDTTLSPIIYALLKKMEKSGYPYVDDMDVPDDLKSGIDIKQWGMESDTKGMEKWNWVFNEMLWAFERLNDPDDEDQFHTGKSDLLWQAFDKDNSKIGEPVTLGTEVEGVKYWQIVDGPNHTSKYDVKGHTLHNERITRGTTLFGKYFRALWT